VGERTRQKRGYRLSPDSAVRLPVVRRTFVFHGWAGKRNWLYILPFVAAVAVALTPLVQSTFKAMGLDYPRSMALRFYAIPLLSLSVALAASLLFSRTAFSTRENDYCRRYVAWLLLAMFAYVAVLCVLKWLRLSTGHYEFFDAGLYDHKMWRIFRAHGLEKIRIAMGEGHFHPLILLHALGYHLLPTPFFPFFLETLTLASGAVPVYLLSRAKIHDQWSCLLVGATYLLYPAVQFNDMLGYHPDHVFLPAMLWAFYFAEKGRAGACLAALIPACLVGEQWLPVVAFFGLYLYFARRMRRAGTLVFLGAGGIFVYVMWFLLPSTGSVNSGEVLFSESSPYRALVQGDWRSLAVGLLDTNKAFFVLFLVGPFLFLPLLAPGVLLVSFPDFCKALFSQEPLHHAVDGHYTLGITAVLLTAYVLGLKRIRDRFGFSTLRPAVLFFLLFVVGIGVSNSPLPLSVCFWMERGVPRAHHYSNYLRDAKTDILGKLRSAIPKTEDIRLEFTNNLYAPFLVHRKGYCDVFPGSRWYTADYILLDRGRPLTFGALSLKERYKHRFAESYQTLISSAAFEKIFAENGIEVYRRKWSGTAFSGRQGHLPEGWMEKGD